MRHHEDRLLIHYKNYDTYQTDNDLFVSAVVVVLVYLALISLIPLTASVFVSGTAKAATHLPKH